MIRVTGCLNSIARLVAFFLVGLFILSLPIAILANSVLKTFFSPDEITDAVTSLLLHRGGFREQLVDHMVSDTWFDPGSNSTSRSLSSLSPADRIEIAQILFPEDWLKVQLQENIIVIINWIDSEEPFPRLVLDLEPLTVKIKQGGAFRIAEIWVDSLAACTVEQERLLDSAIQQGSTSRLEYCRPEGELRKVLIEFTDQQFLQRLDEIPMQISLFDEMSTEDGMKGLGEFQDNILGFILIMRWSRLFPFLFLGLLMIFAIRSWQDMRRWWGIPVGLGALFSLGVILIGNVFGSGILNNALSQSTQAFELQEPIVNVIWDLLSKVLDRSAFQAVVLLILAGLVFTIPILLHKKEPDTLPKPFAADATKVGPDELPPPPTVEPFLPGTITNASASDQGAENEG
jgi:hypothetical protein